MAVTGNTERDGPLEQGGGACTSVSDTDKAPAPDSLVALSLIFRTEYRYLVRFCRMRVRNDADAEDIVQSAFLSARRAYSDKGPDELGPLLMALVRNRMLDFLKSGDRKRQQASVEISDFADQIACGRTPTPEQLVMDQESLSLADALIAAMPPRRREALLLHRVEGLTHTQIALRLSVSRQTVIVDIAEAVAALAEGLTRAERQRTSPGAR
jgi:RNA polymerase sigma factor (sigma-70 family)